MLDELGPGFLAQLGDERARGLGRGRPAVGGEREGLARPGDRDVQEPALLLGVEVADRHGLAQELAREEAPVALADRPLPLEQVRDEDVEVLEALGLVEGHEPDALHVLGELDARRQLAAGGLVGVEVVDEVAQRARRDARAASRRRSA